MLKEHYLFGRQLKQYRGAIDNDYRNCRQTAKRMNGNYYYHQLALGGLRMTIITIGSVTLQADDNGMVTLQCDRCKSRFKMSSDYLNDELDYVICCPVCGISGEPNAFYPEEVIEAGKEIALAQAEQLIANMFKGLNSKNIKVKENPVQKIDRERVFKNNDLDMLTIRADCCGKDFALTPIDTTVGYYCPYCGRIIK